MRIVLPRYQSVSCMANAINSCFRRLRFHQYVALVLIYLVMGAAIAQAVVDIPTLSWTPRSDWKNVKTAYGAKGDGSTDDTAAIQAALNTVANGVTIYFPPGTYKVSSTLVIPNPGYRPTAITLLGHGATTVLAWYGASGGTLITNPGCALSQFIGLKLDGRGIAAVGFDNNNVYFDSESRWKHMGFYNFTTSGLQTNPTATTSLAEASLENCVFNTCGSGLKITKYNDYDFTVAGCDFINCGYGINCTHGNFYARDCYFQGSTIADIYGDGTEHGCSVRRCVSYGAVQFISYASAVAPLDVQDCYVSGWTSTGGAISQSSWGHAPLVLHNNSFVNPPNSAAPVRCLSGTSQPVLVCNNSTPSSSALISPVPTVYTIPAGAYGRNVAANGGVISSFIKTNVTVPTVVYDAKAYGAKGDAATDDTVAIQNTINAARAYGRGAIAYLPTGTYKITSTLTLSGSNYTFGGTGYMSRLMWAGSSTGTMVGVSDPQNLRLENISIGDMWSTTHAVDVQQNSSGTSSYMTYSGVWVYGCYKRQCEVQGLMLNGLGSNSIVVLEHLDGNLRVINSARATILGNNTYEGSIVLDDSTSTVRDGFLGFMTRLTTLDIYPMIIRNNNSLVTSDYYTEQGDNGPVISGVAGNPSGRVTISGPKTSYTATTSTTFLSIDNYQGSIYYGANQFYLYPAPARIVHTGTRALDVVLMGASFYNNSLTFTTSGSALFYAFGNVGIGTGVAPANNYTTQTLANASAAFDDLQRLGDLDLALNFSYLNRNLHFKFNEATGGNGCSTADSSGKGNTGYLVNGSTWVTGVEGSALIFNGTTAYAYSPTAVGIPAGNSNQTISWWQYVSTNPTTQMIAVHLRNNGASTGICTGFNAGLFGVWQRETGSWLVSTVQPTVNAWHHCAYTFDGTTHRLYIDGALVSNSTATPGTSVASTVMVGAYGGWGGAGNFAGSIDDVRIYQRALSAAEVQSIDALVGY